MPGYRQDILEDENNFHVRLLCCICQLLLRNAVQSMCGHRYCESCVKDRFANSDAETQPRCPECPSDSDDGIWNEKEIYPDFHARKELKNLKVKCYNEGCPWRGTFQQYTEHEPLCDLEPVKCIKSGCGKSLRRGDVRYHLEKDCPMRPVKCRNCGQSLAYKQMKKHNPECPKLGVTCSDCKKKIPRDSLKSHQDFESGDCPNRKQLCPFAHYGCDIQISGNGMFEHLQTEAVYHVQLQNAQVDQIIEKMVRFLSNSQEKQVQHAENCVPSEVGKTVCNAESEDNSAASYSKGAATADSEVAYMQLPQESVLTLTDGEVNRLKIIFKQMFVTRDDESEVEIKPSTKSGLNNSPKPSQSVNRVLDKKIRDIDGQFKEKIKELDQMKTLYAVLDKRNETFQEVVAVLNNQLEALAEKANMLERQNRHLQDTIEQQDRQIHAHDQMLTVKSVALAEQELRIQSLELSSYNGVLVWKISEYARRRRDAVSGKTTSFYSPAFHTSYHGYKMRARIYLNGDGMGKGTHVSLFFVIMKGRYDNVLRWPFKQKVTFMMVDQGNQEHVVDAFRPDPTSSSFKKPTHEMNIASGCPLFVSLSLLESSNYSYVQDDCLFVKVVCDVTDLDRM